MSEFDKIAQEKMLKEYASNSRKFYAHIEECDSCRTKLAEIWNHVYSK